MIYDLVCHKCEIIYENIEHSIKEDHPNCPKCNNRLETYFDPEHIPGMKMGVTGIKKSLPSELQKYYAQQQDNDRLTASEMAKDIVWPTGEKHKGTKQYTREKVDGQMRFKPEFRNS